jgi:uncharacterized circularly permuted ATP-grasp superfamily protein
MPERPVIAIVDWADVSTFSEFELHQEHFTREGYETIICCPQDFRVNKNKALAGNREVHLVYRRVITRELVKKWADTTGFLDCIRRGLVCCCNSFRSYIVGNKKVLSLIRDPVYQEIFTPEEIRMIGETVPWTKILSDSTVEYHGKSVDLKDLTLSHRTSLVMKPANMYGGKDVHIGHETEPDQWKKIMETHMPDESWVVQEYVEIPTDVYPGKGPEAEFRTKYVNINPFALQEKYSGTITRVSEHPVINVSAGGGLVPTFTAHKKS